MRKKMLNEKSERKNNLITAMSGNENEIVLIMIAFKTR